MITVNNQRDSVSLPPLVAKPKKGKSQTVAPTLPKSQGPKASGALFKKKTKPKSKRPPTETKESLPKPTEGYEKSHLVSSGTGTRKSQPLPESTVTPLKDSEGNDQPLDKDLTFMTSDKVRLKPRRVLKDEDQESDEKVLANGDDMDEDHQDDKEVRTPSPKQDHSEPSHMSRVLFNRTTKKQWEWHEEAGVSYTDLKASVDQYYDENIDHKDQTDKLVEASMSSLDRSSTTIGDIYKGMNVIINFSKKYLIQSKMIMLQTRKSMKPLSSHITETALKREFFSLRQDTSEIKSIMTERYAAFQGRPSSAPSGSFTPTLAVTDIQENVKGGMQPPLPLKNLFLTPRGRLKNQDWKF
nr:hypothetical protein [Tanacetum cinerariifolium]